MFVGLLPVHGKQRLIDLAFEVAIADGEFDAVEKATIDALRKEAGLPNYEPRTVDIEALLNAETTLGLNHWRAIYLELLGVAFADGHVSDEESEYMDRFASVVGLESEFQVWARTWVSDFIGMVTKASQTIEAGP